MYHIVFFAGLLQQMAMTQGKGVGIHNNRGDSLSRLFLQPITVLPEAIVSVFHKDHLVCNSDDLMKSKIGKKSGIRAFGIEEHVQIASLGLYIHQMADDPDQQSLASAGASNGKATDGVAKAASGCHQIFVFVVQTAGIVQIGIPANSFLPQQQFHFAQSKAIRL
jgi:hypothetical protein